MAGTVVAKVYKMAIIGFCFAVAGCQNAGSLTFRPTATPVVTADIIVSNVPSEVGRTQLAAGNYGLAERSFREAVEKNPADTGAWVGLAAAYDNLRRYDLADRAYSQAVQTGGETLEVTNNLGYSFWLRGDDRRAIVQFKRALVLDPGNITIENNIRLVQSGRAAQSPLR